MKKSFLTFLISVSTCSISLLAQTAGRDMTKEHQIENQLQTIDPSMVENFKAGTIAMDAGNFHKADSLYSIVYARDSSFVPVIRRLGSINTSMGNVLEGIKLCEKAVAIDKSADNIIMLAGSLINSGGSEMQASNENLTYALSILQEGKDLPGADDYEFNALIGQVSLELGQMGTFQEVTNSLMAKHSDKLASHYYAALSAAQNEEWLIAEKEINIAKSMGLSDEAVNKFLDSGVRDKAATAHYKNIFYWILIFWASGFVVLFLLGLLLSSYTLSSVEREFKNNSTSKSAHILRGIYRFLINIAGLYYYISLPIILILVVIMVAGAFYLFLMIGRIPIQLMAILVVCGCITIYSMIKSLLVKSNASDPGRELKESDAPGLFALTREVAMTMGTRPIDEIRITPEVEVAVYEKGSWSQKMRDKGKRILILGTGVVKDFKQNDFRAVIAHEYGHFSHRDTAGGAVALQVRRDMHKYFIALFVNGQTVWWNLAFQFLRLYDFIFRRISNGATRLQEILADRVAAQTYGAVSFQNGLTYVIKRNIEFVKLAKSEIDEAKKMERPFKNLYELSGNYSDAIETELQKSLNRKTTNEDTHPSPVDRFRFIQGLGAGKQQDNSKYVRDLFTDWNAITEEMTKKVEESWKKR